MITKFKALVMNRPMLMVIAFVAGLLLAEVANLNI